MLAKGRIDEPDIRQYLGRICDTLWAAKKLEEMVEMDGIATHREQFQGFVEILLIVRFESGGPGLELSFKRHNG